MKKLKLSIAILSLLAVAACKKTTDTTTGTVTTDDAADMVTNSLASNSGIADVSSDVTADINGITGFATSNTVSLNSLHTTGLGCGETKTNSTTKTSAAGAVPSYSYTSNYTHVRGCNPDNVKTTGTHIGTWSGPHLTTTSSSSINFTVTGIEKAATAYVVNGEYKRSGTYKSKPDTTKAGSSNVDLIVKDLTIDKHGKKISGGTGTITISGTSKKGSFNYTGTITFTADKKATVTIDGHVYTIDLELGEKIKVK